MFDIDSPEVNNRESKKVIKTPRRAMENNDSEIFDFNEENSPASNYNTPSNMSNVTMSRGRQSRKLTPKPSASYAISDSEESPLSVLSGK